MGEAEGPARGHTLLIAGRGGGPKSKRAPREERVAAGGPASPAGALGRFLIPIDSLYWSFVVFRALCTAVNVQLIRRETELRVAPTWGYAGVVLWLLAVAGATVARLSFGPNVGLPVVAVATLCFLVFMVGYDRALAEVARLPADPRFSQ